MAWLCSTKNAKKTVVFVFLLSCVLIVFYFQNDTSIRILHGTRIKTLHKYYSHHRLHQKEYNGSINHLMQRRLSKKYNRKFKCIMNKVEIVKTYDVAYDWSVGANEIRQYRHFMTMNPGFKFHTVKEPRTLKFDHDYHYNIKQVAIDGIAESGVSFRIEEHYRMTNTSGGSCFYVFSETVESTVRQMCSFWDFFNGTYIVWCPAMGVQPCMNISVLLQHTNFTAYSSCSHPMHHVIWRDTLCQCKTNYTDNLLASPKLGLRVVGLPKSPILWKRTMSNHFSLMTQPDQTFQPMNESALCACVKRFRKIIMIGASHMRFKADYLIWKCYKLPVGLKPAYHSLSVENIEYKSKSRGGQFKTLLNDELGRDKLNRNDVVILQTGAHDMAYIGLPLTLDKMIDSYGNIVAQLKRRSEQIGFKLFVVTSPPVADDQPQYRRGSRNCCALSAFVHQLQERLLPVGVDIFDEYSVILPWERQAACTGHYLCFHIRRNHPISLKGDVGELALLLLMERVCGITR